MQRNALGIMLISTVSRVLGFVRDVSLSYFYGASGTSDAFLISQTIPLTIFDFVGNGIVTSFVPLHRGIIKDEGEDAGNTFTNHIVNLTLLACIVITMFVVTFADPIVLVFASGFHGATLHKAVQFTRITTLAVGLSGLTFVFAGYLNSKGNFSIPAFIGVPFNLVLIFTIAISTSVNAKILAIGCVIAIGSQVVWLIPFAWKRGYRYRLSFGVTDPHIKRVLKLAVPVILGVSVSQIDVLVDRTVASRISSGGISALTYASRVNWFVLGFAASSIATVMYSQISNLAAEQKMMELKEVVLKAINSVNMLVIPATLGSIVFAGPIVSVLFGRGAFDARASQMTSNALIFYSLGMLGIGLRELIARVFYSLQDTKTPMKNAVMAVGLNIVLIICLSRFMGISGIALATSVSATFCSVLLFVNLWKRLGHMDWRNIVVPFVKISLCSVSMAAACKVSFNELTRFSPTFVALLLSVGFGVVLYAFLLFLCKMEDMNEVVRLVRARIKFGQSA